eukprot:scaffold126537_cov30-Tisochrysis_lutea.AAC.5
MRFCDAGSTRIAEVTESGLERCGRSRGLTRGEERWDPCGDGVTDPPKRLSPWATPVVALVARAARGRRAIVAARYWAIEAESNWAASSWAFAELASGRAKAARGSDIATLGNRVERLSMLSKPRCVLKAGRGPVREAMRNEARASVASA